MAMKWRMFKYSLSSFRFEIMLKQELFFSKYFIFWSILNVVTKWECSKYVECVKMWIIWQKNVWFQWDWGKISQIINIPTYLSFKTLILGRDSIKNIFESSIKRTFLLREIVHSFILQFGIQFRSHHTHTHTFIPL